MTTFDLIQRTRDLSDRLSALRAPNGTSHVYNPLVYMRRAHEQFLDLYAGQPRDYLILGMNPGPWGMVQTGVPFGDVPNASAILGYRTAGVVPAPDFTNGGITLAPGAPFTGPGTHPQRPVMGFACRRVEASGERLWAGLAQIFAPGAPMSGCTAEHRKGRHELYANGDRTSCRACGERWEGGTNRDRLEAVTSHCFAMNYCPLAYFSGPSGENLTPEDFKSRTRQKAPNTYYDPEYLAVLDAACTPYLRAVVDAMQVKVILAVGKYAERKAAITAALAGRPVRVVYLVHPSPKSTSSAEQWATMARETMSVAGVLPKD